MKKLNELIEDPKSRAAILDDSVRVLDDEMAKRSGISGMALKGMYKMIKKAQKGQLMRKALDYLMEDFIEKLEPYYEKYQKESGGASWSAYLSSHYETLADELLVMTDEKAKKTQHDVIRTTYKKFRPKARSEVITSLPALARMMERYL